ncbi:uncharacterized protein LOC144863534 isoform X1 [Branchiostoma floridae x Branchiostoma japonicum]
MNTVPQKYECEGMSDKPSGPGPCIPEKSHCALCQVQQCVQYCAQCQRSYCQDCFKSEHGEERQDGSRSEGVTTSVSSSCAAASRRCCISSSLCPATTVPLSTSQRGPVSVSPLVHPVTDSVSTRCIVPVSQALTPDVSVPLKTAQAGSDMQSRANVYPIVHPSLTVLTAAQSGNARSHRFTVPCVTEGRFTSSYPTLQSRHGIPTAVHPVPVATFRPTMHARPTVPPAIQHRPVVARMIQPGPRMHRIIQPKPAFVVEPRLPIPPGVPHVSTPTPGATQPNHVCSRHPGMLVQWVDIASRAGLCTKCLEGNVVQNSSTIYRLEQLMAEPTQGHNMVQTCQKHPGLPLVWYSKMQNKLLCSKCCEEGAANMEKVLSYGGIHDEMWGSYQQLKVWEERAKVAKQMISNTQEKLETNIRGLRGSVRMCLRHILSEVVAKLKKREEALMIQASREFHRQQQELGQLQSVVMGSQQANLQAQQLVSHTMQLGPCNQKFCELMERVQVELSNAAAADKLVPTEITLPTLPPCTLDQGHVNELLLMVDSLGSCSDQPPPPAPQLLMHTQGAQVLLRWRWLSAGAAGAGRCEFELQCAILPIMVSRVHNQGHKSASVSTSNQAEVRTPDQQTGKGSSKTPQGDVTIQSRYTGSMSSCSEPSKEGSITGSKTAEEPDTLLEKGSQPPCTPQGSVDTPDTVSTPVCHGTMALQLQSTHQTTLTDVISETIETFLAKKSGPIETVDIRQPENEGPTLMGNGTPEEQVKKQQQSSDAKQSEVPGKMDARAVNEDTSGTRDAEECEITVVLEKDGDKDVIAEMKVPGRKGALPCTCSDLSAISICPAHFKLHLSSDEASSRSSDSPVQVSWDHTTKTAPGSLYKEQLIGSENSSNTGSIGSLEERKAVANETQKPEETSQRRNSAEQADINASTNSVDDVILMETTQSNIKWQVCPPRNVPQPAESVKIVFTGEGNGYSNYRLECSDPCTTNENYSEPRSRASPFTILGSTRGQSSHTRSLSSNNDIMAVGKQQGVSQAHMKVARQTEGHENVNTTETANKDNDCAKLGGQQQMISGRHGSSSVLNISLPETGNVLCRDKSMNQQQYLRLGRDGTKLPDVALQTATEASWDDSRPTGSSGTNQSGEKTPADVPQQVKPGTPAVTGYPSTSTGPHSEDTRPEQTKTSKQSPQVPNRAFRTIYIGPAFQHSLLLETSGAVYVFRVRASNAGGSGPWSNAVQHVYRVAKHPRQVKKVVERGTQTPKMSAHLKSPRKSPAQQKGKGKRKTVLLDTSAPQTPKMDLPKPSMPSGKGGGFHSRMHERLLVRANIQGAPKTKKGRLSVSDNKAEDPPKPNSNARQKERTPKKRKADQDNSLPPKQVKGVEKLSDQCREAWQSLANCTPEKSKPLHAKENETRETTGKEKTPSLRVECREGWQNIAYSTPENGRLQKTPSLSEECHKPTHITPEMSKPSSLKKGRGNRGSDRLKTPLKVRWSFPKTHQSGSGDTLTGISTSNGSCVSKEDARYAVTAVTNLVDALVSWPIDVEVDKDVDEKTTPRRTPKCTPDRPSSSKRRRRQSDPSPSLKAAGRTPQTPASLRQRRAPDYFEECESIVRAVFDHPDGKLFQLPVKVKEVPDYYDIVKDPMDLDCIKKRLRELYYIIMPDQFLADMKKVFRNCHLYNKPDSEVGQAGFRLESYFIQMLCQYLPTVSYKPVYKLPPADGQESPPTNSRAVHGEPDECCPEGGRQSMVEPTVEEKHDVFCVAKETERSTPSAANNMVSYHEVKTSGSTQEEESLQKPLVESHGKQVRSGPMEVQENPVAVEVVDVSRYANGGTFHDPTTAQGIPTTVTMSESEEVPLSAPNQESPERNTTSIRIGEAVHTNTEGAEPEVSQTVHEEKASVDSTNTKSPTEFAESVTERNPILDSNKDSSVRKESGSPRNSTDKSAAQGKKRRERKDKPSKGMPDEEIGALEPWWSYKGEFAVINNPVNTVTAEQVTDIAPHCANLHPFRSLSSPSLTTVGDEGDAVLSRNRQRSVSAVDAAEDITVRPTNPSQMALTTLRSPNKEPVIASCLSSSPLQITVPRSNLQGGDATGSQPLTSHNTACGFGQEMTSVDVVGVLMSENSTVGSLQEQIRVEGHKSPRSPSREAMGSDMKTTVDLTQKGFKNVQPEECSTKPKRSQKARKSFPRHVPQEKQVHSHARRVVSGDEQEPITAQPSTSAAKYAGTTGKGAPLFAGKGRKKTARKSIRMKVTENPHLLDLVRDSPN